MERLSITFPENLKRELDAEAKIEHTKRSTLIQKACRVYLQLKKEKNKQSLLREGYQELYNVSKEIMKDFEELDRDSLKFLDM